MVKPSEIWAKHISYGGYRPDSAIKFIVIHYTGNPTDTARANARFFAESNTRAAGAHYFVDANEIVQSIGDHKVAYSVGGSKYPNCASTGGGKLYGTVTNYNSISIEMCSTHGAIAPETIQNTVELSRQLMRRFNIPSERVIRHFDVNGKDCPGWSGWTGRYDSKWVEFKKKIKNDVLWYGVTTDNVRVHSSPRAISKIVTTMAEGSTVAVVDETKNWVLRKHGGWVAKKHVKRK